jgi:hypothetical protein
MDTPLFYLPGEIRNMIYVEHFKTVCREHNLKPTNDTSLLTNEDLTRFIEAVRCLTPLFTVSFQVRQEAR